VSWPGADVGPLVKAGLEARSGEDAIGDAGRSAVEGVRRSWARLWGRLPLLDGKSFRELVAWREVSLLWLTEAFIRDETAGPRCARLAAAALRLLDATRPDEVDAMGLPAPAAILLARACTVRGVLHHGSAPRARPLRSSSSRRERPSLLRLVLPGRGGPLPPGAPGTGSGASLLVLLGPGADAESLVPFLRAAEADLGMRGVVVPAAALGRWETRRVRRAVKDATRRLREHGQQLRRAPGLHESYTHRGVGFADLARGDLDAILRHLPDGVRLLETAAELVAAARPAVLGLAGWPRDQRRALLAGADGAGTVSLVLRIGAEDQDDLDRADGGPRARVTIALEPGGDPAPALARLREAARATLEPA
jgi:hypothetical protein